MNPSKFLFSIAIAGFLSACNSAPDPGQAVAGGHPPPLESDPHRHPHRHRVRLAPPAAPKIPSRPLPAIFPPPPPRTLPPPAALSITLLPPPGTAALSEPPPPGCTSYTLGMQVLVISADGTEPTYQAIQQALGYHTVPYTAWIATQKPGQLTAAALASGCAGTYQGVILATGGLAYSPNGGVTFLSALSATEWQALRAYESSFHVRELAWYVYPGADQGLNPPSAAVDTSNTPINATLTAAGRAAFPYVNTSNPIPISLAWTYLTTAADPKVTPLLVDGAGHPLMSTRATPDGRETMALTYDSNPYLLHELVLAHGMVEWLTKGIYLGEFRTYLTPQIDDLFIDDDIYGGGTYRITATDFTATHSWQVGQQAMPGNSGFRLAWAFNGVGGSDFDPLTIAASTFSGDYHWINHTWDHENLDAMAYGAAYAEFDQNNQFAVRYGLQNYYTSNLVTPDVSGITNQDVLQAAVDTGVRYLVSDTSQPGWGNPAPNIGIYSVYQPSILFIPRRPTNLFYNVSTPAEWTAEYNAFYTTFWGRALTYPEVLDKESENLFRYMMQGEIDPHMYHQPNARAYDGVHTLLGDLHDMAIQKYRKYSTLPIQGPEMQVAGARMANTMARNGSGLSAAITPGTSVTFSSPADVQFALSGVCSTGSESYSGKCITTVNVTAGSTVTMPIP
jgi:hypothetical protein